VREIARDSRDWGGGWSDGHSIGQGGQVAAFARVVARDIRDSWGDGDSWGNSYSIDYLTAFVREIARDSRDWGVGWSDGHDWWVNGASLGDGCSESSDCERKEDDEVLEKHSCGGYGSWVFFEEEVLDLQIRDLEECFDGSEKEQKAGGIPYLIL
jgi:hypothetical protein